MRMERPVDAGSRGLARREVRFSQAPIAAGGVDEIALLRDIARRSVERLRAGRRG